MKAALNWKILTQSNSLRVNCFHFCGRQLISQENTHSKQWILHFVLQAISITFSLPPLQVFFSEKGSKSHLVYGYFVLITGTKSPDRLYLQLSVWSYNKLMADSTFFPLQLKSLKVTGSHGDSWRDQGIHPAWAFSLLLWKKPTTRRGELTKIMSGAKNIFDISPYQSMWW